GDGPVITANRQLVGQAVANLIDNAIKYSARATKTHTSGAEITVSLTMGEEGLEIGVGDRGPGIAVADRERVLRRFVRLEKSRTEPGTGLGLSLVQAVARLHGGSVRLEDNEPGLRVVLTLPRRLAE
ncbi:MAG: sensor histidine kinase, partial [Hyphomicrobiaceae bacterium]|nr:sensor histidine kinase [Hyphomicrobiaceae bacterium]